MHSLDKKRQASKRTPAPVAKLVDAPDLGSGVERRVGSSPIRRTPTKKSLLNISKLFFVNGISVNKLSKTTTHTTADRVKPNNGLIVTKDGRILKGKQEEYISDCTSDADTDLLRCIPPYVSDPNKMSGHLFVDDLMAAAGYVNGETFSLKSPVILHKDNNPTNFNSDNLKWVESTDPRYIEYQKKVKEWKHQRNVELNPGQQLHPGW